MNKYTKFMLNNNNNNNKKETTSTTTTALDINLQGLPFS